MARQKFSERKICHQFVASWTFFKQPTLLRAKKYPLREKLKIYFRAQTKDKLIYHKVCHNFKLCLRKLRLVY